MRPKSAICWILTLALGALPTWAQDAGPVLRPRDTQKAADAAPCQAYFQIVQIDARIAGGYTVGGNDAQQKWWEKKGRKKYPGLCWDGSVTTSEKPRYLLVWVEEGHSKLVDIPVTTTSTSEAPVTGSVTDAYGQPSGTISGTVEIRTAITYHELAERNWTTASISVLRVTPDNKLEDSPVYFYVAGPGPTESVMRDWYGVEWSSASQKAMERAVKYLATSGSGWGWAKAKR